MFKEIEQKKINLRAAKFSKRIKLMLYFNNLYFLFLLKWSVLYVTMVWFTHLKSSYSKVNNWIGKSKIKNKKNSFYSKQIKLQIWHLN